MRSYQLVVVAGSGLKGGESTAESFRTVGGAFGVYVFVLFNDDNQKLALAWTM